MIDFKKEKIEKEINFIISDREKRLGFLQKEINQYINEDYSTSFYDYVIGDWLDTLSNLAHLVWIDVQYQEETVNNEFCYVPFTALDFRYLRIDKKFHSQLYRIKKKKLNKIKFKLKKIQLTKKYNFNNILEFFIKKILNLISKKEIYVYSFFYLGKKRRLFKDFLKFSNKIFFPKTGNIYKNQIIDEKWRLEKLNQFKNFNDSFTFFQFLIFLYLPVSILENLKKNIDIAKKNILNQRPKILISSLDLHNNLIFKLETFFFRKNNAKLIYMQHGGNYGADSIHQFENYEVGCSDLYISWGWKRNSKKITKLPIPYLPDYNKKSKNCDILYILGNYPSFPYRVHFQPMGKIRVNKMRNDSLLFLENIKKNLFKINIRPYQDYDNDLNEKLLSYSDCKLDNIKDVFESMNSSKLIVHNYLCTSYLMSLYLDLPTVCFYDSEVYEFSNGFLKYAKIFKQEGIFHECPKKAAKFVNNTNIQDWWSRPDFLKKRDEFRGEFTYFAEDWTKTWIKEIKNL